MKNTTSHFFISGENRRIFFDGNPPPLQASDFFDDSEQKPEQSDEDTEIIRNVSEMNTDRVSSEAQKFINENNIFMDLDLKGQYLRLPKANLNLNGDGKTKWIDVYMHGKELNLDIHNANGTIDKAIVNSRGEFTIKENVNARREEGAESAEAKETLDSHANAPHTIADAFRAAEKFTGKNLKWEMPPRGKQMAEDLPQLKKELPQLADVLDSIAQQGGVNKVNKFLEEKGFTIRLENQGGPFDVYAASVLDMNVRWKAAGKATTMQLAESDKEVDSVVMKSVAAVFESRGHDNPIVQIDTKDGDMVFMTRYEGAIPEDQTSLRRIVQKLAQSKKPADRKYAGAEFPMVDFDKSGDIMELIGARSTATDGDPLEIRQAKYQHRLRMNEIGARAQAAAAIGMLKGFGPAPVVIDGPFILWFERDGIIPFSAKINEEHMKKPRNLE